jgi:syntaxin-binding protein 5
VDWILASGPSVRVGNLVIMLVLLSTLAPENVSENVESDTCKYGKRWVCFVRLN